MKTNGVAFLIEHFYVILGASVFIVIVLLIYNKFNIIKIENSQIKEDKQDTNFLIDYDIKSSVVGGIIIVIVGFLTYFIQRLPN